MITFTMTNPVRFAAIVAGTAAYFIFGDGPLVIAFLLGTIVGSVSFETKDRRGHD